MRRFQLFLTCIVVAILAYAESLPSPNPYPNELPGFKFYAKYLNPLCPYVSDNTLVVRVLGSDQRVQQGNWWILPFFIGDGTTINGHTLARDVIGRLASIAIIPRKRVSMLGTKFPAAFAHGEGGSSSDGISLGKVVPGTSVSIDIYSDDYGLQYWLYAEDSTAGKKGDLLRIQYGHSKRIQQHAVDSSR